MAKSDSERYGGTKAINSNTHENYWKAYWNNLTNIVSLGNINIIVTVDDYFYPIHPLDLIMLNLPSKSGMFPPSIYQVYTIRLKYREHGQMINLVQH